MSNKPWLAHYDKGVPQTIDYPKAPLFHFLEEAARKYPDRACTIFKGAVISYRELNALCDQERRPRGDFYAEYTAVCDRVLRHPQSRGGCGGNESDISCG